LSPGTVAEISRPAVEVKYWNIALEHQYWAAPLGSFLSAKVHLKWWEIPHYDKSQNQQPVPIKDGKPPSARTPAAYIWTWPYGTLTSCRLLPTGTHNWADSRPALSICLDGDNTPSLAYSAGLEKGDWRKTSAMLSYSYLARSRSQQCGYVNILIDHGCTTHKMLLPDVFCVCQALGRSLTFESADFADFMPTFSPLFFPFQPRNFGSWEVVGAHLSRCGLASLMNFHISIVENNKRLDPWRLQLSPNQLSQALALIGVYKWKENSKKSTSARETREPRHWLHGLASPYRADNCDHMGRYNIGELSDSADGGEIMNARNRVQCLHYLFATKSHTKHLPFSLSLTSL
jgi:hypothetical protein